MNRGLQLARMVCRRTAQARIRMVLGEVCRGGAQLMGFRRRGRNLLWEFVSKTKNPIYGYCSRCTLNCTPWDPDIPCSVGNTEASLRPLQSAAVQMSIAVPARSAQLSREPKGGHRRGGGRLARSLLRDCYPCLTRLKMCSIAMHADPTTKE